MKTAGKVDNRLGLKGGTAVSVFQVIASYREVDLEDALKLLGNMTIGV